jgi:hypothetical protein
VEGRVTDQTLPSRTDQSQAIRFRERGQRRARQALRSLSNPAAKRLEAESIPAPRGGRTWNRPTLRKFILSDVYLRHSYEEVARIVSGEVAATLDPSAHYGISWYGKQRHTHSRKVCVKDGKKTYP